MSLKNEKKNGKVINVFLNLEAKHKCSYPVIIYYQQFKLELSQRWYHRDSDIIFRVPAAAASPTPEPDSPVTRETISVKLLTSVRPRGPASSSPAAIGRNSQEQLVSDHWFSALNLSEDPTVCTHIAGTRLASASWNVFIFFRSSSFCLPPISLSCCRASSSLWAC